MRGGSDMIRITNARLELNEANRPLEELAARLLKVRRSDVKSVRLVKKSVDARDKGDVHFVCALDVEVLPMPARLPKNAAMCEKARGWEVRPDDRLPEAVEIVVEAGQASVSMLQRRMRVGYARAGRLIDEMEQRGIVSEADGSKPRSVLITREQMNELFE